MNASYFYPNKMATLPIKKNMKQTRPIFFPNDNYQAKTIDR